LVRPVLAQEPWHAPACFLTAQPGRQAGTASGQRPGARQHQPRLHLALRGHSRGRRVGAVANALPLVAGCSAASPMVMLRVFSGPRLAYACAAPSRQPQAAPASVSRGAGPTCPLAVHEAARVIIIQDLPLFLLLCGSTVSR